MDIINNFATKFVPKTQSDSQSLFFFFKQIKSGILILLVRNCVYKFSTDNLKALELGVISNVTGGGGEATLLTRPYLD